MNKNGMVFLYGLMLGTLIIIFGIASAYPTKQVIDTSRTDLTCETPSTDWIEAECVSLDILKFVIPAAFIFIGFAVIRGAV